MKKTTSPKTVNNITDLWKSLSETRDLVFSNKLDIEVAESMNNAAGKMIKIAALKASFLTPDEAKKVDILK